MTKRAVLAVVLGLNCDGEPRPCSGDCSMPSGGDSDGDDDDDDCITHAVMDPAIVEASVTCNDSLDEVTVGVLTYGYITGGWFYAIETADPTPWAEEHDLDDATYNPCSDWDRRWTTLRTGASVDDQVRQESTVFSCDTLNSSRIGVAPLSWTPECQTVA